MGPLRMQSGLNEVIRVGANVTGFVSLEDRTLRVCYPCKPTGGLCEPRGEWRPPVTRKRMTSSTQDDITCGHHHLDPGLSACRLCGINVCGSGCPVCDVVQGSLNQDKDRYHDQGLCSPLCHPKSQVQGKTSSVQFSRSVVSNSLQPHEPQHPRPPCPSPAPRVHPNPRPLSR